MQHGDSSLIPHPESETLSPAFRALERALEGLLPQTDGTVLIWVDPADDTVLVRLMWGENQREEHWIPLQDFATRAAYVSLSRFRTHWAGKALREECDVYLGGAVCLRPEGAVLHAFDGDWRYDPEAGRLVPWEGRQA